MERHKRYLNRTIGITIKPSVNLFENAQINYRGGSLAEVLASVVKLVPVVQAVANAEA